MPIQTTITAASQRTWGWQSTITTPTTNLWLGGINSANGLGFGNNGAATVFRRQGNAEWRSVAVGQNHGIGVKPDGTLWSWGSNNNGQLGLSNFTNASTPVQIGALTTWVRAYASTTGTAGWSLAVKSDGTAWSWGTNSSGQLGLGTLDASNNSPVQVLGSLAWTGSPEQASLGEQNVLMVTNTGALYSWGDNAAGAIGNGTTINVSTPVQIAGTWNAVSSGAAYSAGIKSDGTLWTWGKNEQYQLGLGDSTRRSSPTQVSLGTAYQSWSMINLGIYSVMGVVYSGATEAAATRQTWAWGIGTSGMLGQGTTTNSSTPVQVSTASPVSQISLSTYSMTGLMIQGLYDTATLWGWGVNSSGQLGLGDTINRSVITQVSVGGIANDDWQTVCSGGNSTAVLYGQYYKFFGVGVNSTTSYQLGRGTSGNVSSFNQVGTENKLWKEIGVGGAAQFAIGTDNTLWAWGAGASGRLGLGDTITRSVPTQVGLLKDWNLPGPTTNTDAFIVVKTDGTLWSWGLNNNGQLGLNDTTNRSSPVQIGTLNTWESAAMSSNVGCAIKKDGTLWTWGTGATGGLGQGNTTAYSSPKQVGTLTNWKAATSDRRIQHIGTVAGGFSVIKSDGTLWSWGSGASGQLGLGNTTNISSPQQVGALTNWVQIIANGNNQLALKTNGSLWSWGDNSSGQLGLGNLTSVSSPNQIGTKLNWHSLPLMITSASMAAIDKDSKIWAWGLNDFGQLGQGSTSGAVSTPIQVGRKSWDMVSFAFKMLYAGEK